MKVIVDITALREGAEATGQYMCHEHVMNIDAVDYYFVVLPTTSVAYATLSESGASDLFSEHVEAINKMIGLDAETNFAHALTMWEEDSWETTNWTGDEYNYIFCPKSIIDLEKE